MQISEFFGGLRPSTSREYHCTHSLLLEWNHNGSFADFLRHRNISENTVAKHVNQARTILKHCEIHDIDVAEIPPMTREAREYPTFSDTDFQALYAAFADVAYPKFIAPEHRHRYWETIIHFASVTAVRRQAILGLCSHHVNFKEHYITIIKALDKKQKERYKPITPDLADDIIDLLRYYEPAALPAGQEKRIFPWGHGNKVWYQCWNAAEAKIGKRFHLHDLKRFSGELALRAGASPLELQQHMDHASINTTLSHYCRPQTTALVKKLKVPIPDRAGRITPLFTEPELAAQVTEILTRRLAEIGITPENLAIDEFGLPRILETPKVPKQKIADSDTRITKEQLALARRNAYTMIRWFDADGEEEGRAVL